MQVTFDASGDLLRADGMLLAAETPGVVRDENGVPAEWTLLKIGENPIVKNGVPGSISLSAADAAEIIDYHRKKGELIPVDSNHYLHELANRKNLDEAEVLKLLPSGVAAMGYGSLALAGDALRFRVQWTPTAYELLKEKIFKYFSPAIRGLVTPPLRITSVAMENEPAINNLDALAASANNRKENQMGKLERALMRLTGRDAIALEAEADAESVAEEVEAKASLIEQVAELLGLEKSATVDEIVAALRAETEKAKSADEKQSQLDELAAAAERRAHDDLVAKGRAEGRIADSDMEYVNSLDSKALSAHLAHCGVKVPVRRFAPSPRPADSAALSASDRIAIDALRNAGIADAEKEYLKTKKQED